MTKNDFINNFADAIMNHEGWSAGSRSVNNNNPGNIRYVGQPNVKPGEGNFCICPDFLSGRYLLTHDIELKMKRWYNIRSIILQYAPEWDGNNTEAYIKAVVAWFHSRNIPVTDIMPITDILALPLEMVLVDLNDLAKPADWHSAQDSVTLCAKNMPEWGFTTRYSSHAFRQVDFYANPSEAGDFYALEPGVTRKILQPLNEGQKLTVLFYAFINNGSGQEAGGVQYGGEAISFEAPNSTFCTTLYEGQVFTESNARAMFHELIHSLFTLTGIRDSLHAYLIAHGGYRQNLLPDLLAAYAPVMAQYKTGARVVKVASEVISVVTTNKDPQNNSYLVQLLIAVGNLLGSWLKGRNYQ